MTTTKKADKVILVRYGEIWLKSDPVKRVHTKRLKANISGGLKRAGIKRFQIARTRDRLIIRLPKSKIRKASDVIRNTFGIVSFSVCEHLETSEVKEIQRFVKNNYRAWVPARKKFAVRCKRSGSHKYTSMQMAKLVGDVVDRKVDLSEPDVEIFVEVRGNDTYFYTDIQKGLGGMPVGTAGKVVCLLSGGIDSPVAAWLMMKRGCVVNYIHFHPFRDNQQAAKSKVSELVRLLSNHQPKMTLYIVPASPFQLYAYVPPKLQLVIFRRFMMRVAERIAKKERAKGIVTGDNLAQVASQTLDNLNATESSTNMPIFRPLLTYDKQEIVDMGKKIGTYPISVKPYKDCCSIVAKKPSTRADIRTVEKVEKEIDVEKLVDMAMDMSESVEIYDKGKS